MTMQTKPLQMPSVTPEARSELRTAVAPKGAEAGRKAYWGDTLTLKIWLFCFVLMLAMELVAAAHRFFSILMGWSPAP